MSCIVSEFLTTRRTVVPRTLLSALLALLASSFALPTIANLEKRNITQLDPTAFAEAHKRDDTATRVFSSVPIITSSGQCLFVDELSGDFRANLIPVQVTTYDGRPGQSWDVITSGEHEWSAWGNAGWQYIGMLSNLALQFLNHMLKGYNELFQFFLDTSLLKLRPPSHCWKPSDSLFLRWSRGRQRNSNEFLTLFFQWFRWATVIVASQCARHLYDHRRWPGARPSGLQHRGCGSEFYVRCCFCDGKWHLAAE